MRRHLVRLLAMLLWCAVALQIVFGLRIAVMRWIDPASSAFERSEARRLLGTGQDLRWRQQWLDIGRIGEPLQRAVIASEDAGFVDHGGIEWDAVERAWARNQRSEARAERAATKRPAKLVGGSTITQQLAKNLLLSGERTVLRKAQEAILAVWLETCLDKRRLLEVYLNHVEWGEGVFGAHAASQRYFQTEPARLTRFQAARLAVMLPAPKRFERRPDSPYVLGRAGTIVARMDEVLLP